MLQFLGDQFSLQSIAAELMWAVILEVVGLTAIMRWLLSLFDKRPKKEWAYWIAMPLFLFLVIGSISTDDRPDFSNTTIESVRVGRVGKPLPPAQPDAVILSIDGYAGLVVAVRLRNVGSPSAIENPEVKLITLAGKEVNGVIVQQINFTDKNPVEVIRTTGINPSPIAARGQIQTITLVVGTPGVFKEEAQRAGTTVRFIFKDAFGRSYEEEHTMTGAFN